MTRRRLLSKSTWWYLIGITVSLVLLFLAFRGVNWAELGDSLRSVDVALILLAVAFLLGSLVARAFRWQVLLAPLVRVSLLDSLCYTLIGYLVNNVVGLRLGEITRAALLGEKVRASKSGVLATVVVERLLDTFSLLLFIALILPSLDLPAVARNSILLGEGIAGAAAVVLVLLVWRGLDLGRLVPRFLPEKVRTLLVALLAGFVQGLQVLKSGRKVLAAVAWSLLSWGLFAATVALFMRAAGLGWLPWIASLLVIVVTNLGSAIPSSPGFVGGFHFLVVYSLKLWAVPQSEALSFAILIHAVDYVVVTALGALALLWENVAFGRLWRHLQGQPSTGGSEDGQ